MGEARDVLVKVVLAMLAFWALHWFVHRMLP